jgi:hypothetical protein
MEQGRAFVWQCRVVLFVKRLTGLNRTGNFSHSLHRVARLAFSWVDLPRGPDVGKKSISLDEQLVEVLRPALAGQLMPLYKSGKHPGIFPGGAGGKKLAEEALKRGFVHSSEAPAAAGKKTKKVALNGRITPLGQQLVLDHDSPKKVLEELREVMRQAAEESRRAAHASLRKVEELQQTFQMVTQAVERASQQAPPRLPAAPVAEPTNNTWIPEIESYLRARWEKGTAGDCPLPELYGYLRQRHSELTIGDYQDAMRQLHDQGRIRLSGWSGPLDGIPNPDLAMFVAHMVMYYARLP